MARYSIPVILACLYVLGSTWLVSNEGRAYRESLRRPSPVASEAPTSSAAEDRESPVVARKDAISEPPESPRREVPPTRLTPVSETPPTPLAAEEKRPSPPVTTPTPSPLASTPAPAAVPAAVPPPNEQAARIAQWKNDAFWSQPALARTWDLDRFTIRDERELGEPLNAAILQLNAEDRQADQERVNRAARPLLEGLQPKEREYKLVVLNSEVPNAFSHPGGYIYISRKLLQMLPEDEDYLLEFVIGHEIAHVELQHALACLKAPDVRRFGDSTLQKLYFLIIPHGYPDRLEYEADAWVYHHMKRLKRSEYECLKFLRILDKYARAHGFQNGRGKPEELLAKRPGEPDDVPAVSAIDNHLRSHPAAYERLNRLKELSGQAAHSPR